MDYSDTTALQKIEAMNARINIIQGGARAGKTVAVLIMICDLSFEVKDKIIHIVSDSYPNLSNGAMTDWKKLLRGTNRASYFNVNQATHTWTNICTNTIVKFIACDAQDALGAQRDYLFANEANRISYDTFGQLEMRTTGTIWIDFNPVNEFWAHTEVMAKRDDWEFIKLTYEDNEAIPENVLKALLQRKGDGNNNFWRVYGMGEIGSLEGNVYSGWLSAEKPENAKLVRYGLDFGFSNDPTAMVAVYECEEENTYWVKQLIYETGMLGSYYGDKFRDIGIDPNVLIVADGARPEIIAEIKKEGFRCIAAQKGPGSILRGIDRIQQQKILYDANSKDLEREFLTYAWRKKKSTGEILDEPEDANNHLAGDALRYAIDDLYKPKFDF